jgi:hypothetical protein
MVGFHVIVLNPLFPIHKLFTLSVFFYFSVQVLSQICSGCLDIFTSVSLYLQLG